MLNNYKELFLLKGTKGFSMAGFIARLPIAMIGIGIITILSQLYGNYWLAGSVAGSYTFATALLAPQISKLVDRFGQFRILCYATLICISSLLLLLACIRFKAPIWTFYLFAIIAGCIPNMSAMVRARWSALFRGKPQLHTAFSLEAVLDELCFIIGPPLSVGLSILLFPEAGVLLAVIFFVCGVTCFIVQRSTEPPIYPPQLTKQKSVISYRIIRTLILVLIAMGIIVGTVDVVSVAFAKQQGQPIGASIVLSLYAVSSCLSGLIFGTLKLQIAPAKIFLISALATAITVLPLPFTYNIITLSIAVFIAGFFFAPTMIITMRLIENILPPSQLTEGLTWAIAGLSSGVALGAALSGWVIDTWTISSGFSIAIFAGLIICVVTLLGYSRLK